MMCQVDLQNQEYDLYDNDFALYNQTFSDYSRHYNRHVMPLQRATLHAKSWGRRR